jgi:hypothetical protein
VKGRVPPRTSQINIPRLQISMAIPYLFPLRISGAVYPYDPQRVLAIASLQFNIFENPKSINLQFRLASKRIFSGLRSL